MSRRRRRQYEETEEAFELQQVLQPDQQQLQWADENWQDEQSYADEYPEFLQEDYSDIHEEADSESRFRIAMGLFDLVSILIGIGVILLLVALLYTLFNWLRNDILHSALLIQSGLQ